MSAPSPDDPGLLNWLLILALGVIWGSAFMSMTLALEGFGPRWVAAGRLGIGALALWALGRAMGQRLGDISAAGGLRAWVFVALIGSLALAVPQLALTWGQQFVTSAFAGVAMGAVPLVVLPLVYVFSPEEGIGPRRVIGFLMGFAGLVILVGPGAVSSAADPMTLWGQLACIVAVCGYAIGSILTRRAPRIPPISMATGILLVAAILVVPFAVLTEPLPNALTLRPTLALVYAALFPTALAAIIRVRVITTAGSLFMNTTSYMVPVWSVVFGITLMGEDLPPQLFTALILILCGIAIAQSRAILTALRRRSRP